MYRSDTPAAAPPPASASAAAGAGPITAPPAPFAHTPVHDPASRFQPDAPPLPDRGWLATGLYFIALPMTLGMTLMFAPVSWMLGARSRR